MIQKPYIPISCDFHDQLEDHSVRKVRTRIRYTDEQNEPQETIGHIVDIWTEKEGEFLKLTSGLILRLDQIQSINDDRQNIAST